MCGEARRGRVICYCRKEEDEEKKLYIVVAQQQHDHNNKRIVKFYSFFVWGEWGNTSLGHFLIIKENDFFVH